MVCLPHGVTQEELIDLIKKVGWEVSKNLKAYNQNIEDNDEFQKKLKIINLESGPVTTADIEISELIKIRIKAKYPQIKWDFLSEEDVKNNQKLEFKSKWVWIIDPIDGTKDFIKQTGQYAMHLALTYEREIILGIVPIPSKDQLWIYFHWQIGAKNCDDVIGGGPDIYRKNIKVIMPDYGSRYLWAT